MVPRQILVAREAEAGMAAQVIPVQAERALAVAEDMAFPVLAAMEPTVVVSCEVPVGRFGPSRFSLAQVAAMGLVEAMVLVVPSEPGSGQMDILVPLSPSVLPPLARALKPPVEPPEDPGDVVTPPTGRTARLYSLFPAVVVVAVEEEAVERSSLPPAAT